MDPKKIIEQNKDVYNRIAEQFSDSRAFIWEDLAILKQFIRSGDRVLDVGCGNGRLLQLFEGLDVSYVGVDQSDALIHLAQEKFPEAVFEVAEMQQLPCKDAAFDIVFCVAALQHLPDEETRLKALAEMKRVVKKNGNIILTNWNLDSTWAKEKYGEGECGNFCIPWKNAEGDSMGERFYHGFTLAELEGLAEQVGLSVQKNYFVKKGGQSNLENGENIITVLEAK